MQSANERVVITGMGILCALGDDYAHIFNEMSKMKSGISAIERFDTGKFQSHIGAEIKEFTFSEYLSSKQEQLYDECAKYAIAAITKALKDSGLSLAESDQERTGLAFGTCNGGILSLEEQWTLENLDAEKTARYPYYQQGDQVAAHFKMQGPVVTLNTACAASGNAIGFAYDMIRGGSANVMVAGGSDPMSHSVYAGFNGLRALNPKPVSPFGNRYGLSLGEGASFIVLESLSQARKRKARIYGEICGYGMSNDAFHSTTSHPEGLGIQLAVEMALENSGVNSRQIGYINAHGTGTKANDQAEINGLRKVFGVEELAEIPLSSSKAYFGHNLGAAAAIELTTSIYAARNGLLPATLHHDETREGCEDANIIANQMIRGNPEYILCNNSAFGGHNVSIVTRMLYENDTQSAENSDRQTNQSKRVGIVGIGQVSDLGVMQGDVLKLLTSDYSKSRDEHPVFSLKAYDATLYERRMNKLCQFGIGSGDLAMKDAGWSIDEEEGRQTGLIYGTSRGSLESISNYLSSVFHNGPEFASSIHFPFNVLNSTSGKMAQKLNLKGFSSSLSTGGNDGLMSMFYGYELIRSGVHQKFVVGAGDELSDLSSKINKAVEIDSSRYQMTEGSISLALADLDIKALDKSNVYAEIAGCGISFIGKNDPRLHYAVQTALQQAELSSKELDFILINSIGRPSELEKEQKELQEMLGKKSIPIICCNELWGYGESLSSIQHLSLAAELLHQSTSKREQVEQFLGSPEIVKHGLVVSSSVNGSTIAVILSEYE